MVKYYNKVVPYICQDSLYLFLGGLRLEEEEAIESAESYAWLGFSQN